LEPDKVLGLRFDGQKAHPSASLDETAASTSILAAGFPWNFSIVYSLRDESELSALIDSVRVLWLPDACGFFTVPTE